MLPVSETGQSNIITTLTARPTSPAMLPTGQSQRPSDAGLPHSHSHSHSQSPDHPHSHAYEPSVSTAHHRPAFTHATTSFGSHPLHFAPHAPQASRPAQAFHASRPPTPTYDIDPLDTTYNFPAEKESPPPVYTPTLQHLTPPWNPHAGSSRYPDSRRSSTDRRVAAPDTSILQCIKSKLMGKEGGMGRALVLGWLVTTLGFVIATAFWRGELFGALDRMSKYLYSLGLAGKGIFLLLILVTTIPPLPLYSTLMVLAGYTFGVWEGFVVSYAASLIGAVLVFVVSRCWLRDVISKSLQSSPTAQTLLAIIPANPHLLLLIRIAPYPYNLLNVILASAPSLSLRTYTACTAVSLFKLVLHTWIGAGIHDIASYGAGRSRGHGGPHGPHRHMAHPGEEFEGAHGYPHGGHYGQHGHGEHGHGHGMHSWDAAHAHRAQVKMYATWAGIALCVGLFFYLTHLAKRALRKAQEEEEARREGGVCLVGSDEEC